MAPRRLLWHILEIGVDWEMGSSTFDALFLYYLYLMSVSGVYVLYVRIGMIDRFLSFGALFSHYM